MRCGRWVIEVVPRPGYGSSRCGNPGCRLTGGVWYFERRLGQTTPASISVPKDPQCCPCVPRKWRDELAFYREDSTGDLDLEWIGPVVDVQDNNVDDVLTIFARDRSTWVLEENPIPQQIAGITEPATSRFKRIWNLVNQLDPSYLQLKRIGAGLGAAISDDVDQWAASSAELSKLQDFGTYWTVVGDELRYGDLAALTHNAALDPSVAWESNGAIISDVGYTSITGLIVVASDGRVYLYPPNPRPDPCEGSHIRRIEPAFDLPGDELAEYARLQFDVWKAQGLQIATSVDSSVSEAWPVCMSDMVPGMTYRVDTSGEEFCLNAETSAQLTAMTVEGRDDRETAIKVGLTPQTGVTSGL